MLAKAADMTSASLLAQVLLACGIGALSGAFCGVVTVLATAHRRRAGLYGNAGLTDVSFLVAVLRRRAWVWCGMAAAGLVFGAVIFSLMPVTYQASVSVLVSRSPFTLPVPAMAGEAAWSRTTAVARAAMSRLGLTQSVRNFLQDYTVTTTGDSVLLVTASARTSRQAVRRSEAIAAAFLQVRARLLTTQAHLRLQALEPAIERARHEEQSASARLNRQLTSRRSPMQLADLLRIRARYARAARTLATLREEADDVMTTPVSMTQGSAALVAIPVPQSQARTLVLCLSASLTGGLTLGVAIVVIGALASGRLRRRDDVALALGVPVSLSTGRMLLVGRAPGRLGLAATRNREIARISGRLRDTLAAGPGSAGLVLVPADRPRIASISLAALALACARDGRRVVVADLCAGAPAARLLGVKTGPGIYEVSVDRSRLTVVIPDRDGDLDDVCRSADVVLGCVATGQGPGMGSLARWAGRAVVMVTAGRSSAVTFQAIIAMIGQSGMALHSVILLGADRADLSAGTARPARRSVLT